MIKDSNVRGKQRTNILIAAESLFIENGIALTTMKDISEEAGIYRRTLYNYYNSKEEIAFAIHEKYIANPFNFILPDDKTGYELLEEHLGSLKDNLHHYFPYIRFAIHYEFYFNNVKDNSESLKKVVNFQLIDVFKAMLERGISDGSIYVPDDNIEMVVQSILQAIFGYLQRVIHREEIFKLESGFSREHLEHVINILLRGLKA